MLPEGAAVRDASVGPSVPHAATNVSAATDNATEYLIADLSTDRGMQGTYGTYGMYDRQRDAPYVSSQVGLRETLGFADRPRGRGAFVGTRSYRTIMRYFAIPTGGQPVGVSMGARASVGSKRIAVAPSTEMAHTHQ